MAEEGEIRYLKANNNDCEIFTNGEWQRGVLVGTPGGFTGTKTPNTNDLTPFGENTSAEYYPMVGWTFAYNINPATISFRELNGGTVTQSGSFANIETGTDPNGNAFIFTAGSAVYSPGIGNVARFTAIFSEPQPNSIQLIGVINNEDGWAFGYNGVDFGILRRSAGVDNWTCIDDWSIGARDDFDPTKLNVYQISYQWLGGGMQYFSIEDADGVIKDVHKIAYSNLNTDVSVNNPNLPLSAGVANTGNTTNISLMTPSASAGSYGEPYPAAFTTLLGYEYSETLTQASDYLFSIRMPDEYESKDNRLYLEFLILSLAISGNNSPVIFRVLLNAQLTGAVWQPINSLVSPAESDDQATSYIGGQEILSVTLSNDAGEVIDLLSAINDTKIYKNQILTLICDKQAGGSVDSTVSVTMRSRI